MKNKFQFFPFPLFLCAHTRSKHPQKHSPGPADRNPPAHKAKPPVGNSSLAEAACRVHVMDMAGWRRIRIRLSINFFIFCGPGRLCVRNFAPQKNY